MTKTAMTWMMVRSAAQPMQGADIAMQKMRTVLGMMVIICMWSFNNGNCTNSTLEQQKSRLEKLHKTRQTTRSEHTLSEDQMQRLKRDIANTQQDILSKAAAITKVEQELVRQQSEVRDMFEKEAKKSHELSNIRVKIARMVSAAWSLQYRPQLAAWLLPEETRQRALASRAVHMTTLSLRKQMDNANSAMLEVQQLRRDIVDKQHATEATQQRLQAERSVLQENTTHQQALLAQLERNESGYSQKISALTKQSESLENLIATLEKAHAEKDAKEKMQRLENTMRLNHKQKLPPIIEKAQTRRDTSKAASFVLAKGRLPLPAEGELAGKFGERRGNNDRLKGLEIHTVKGGLVTTPYEGEVLYTGTFLDYGKMVILRHSRDYHTLVAGLSRIDVSVGQFLLDGEPIGAMGEGGDQRNLYLELRKSSQAIDPEPWFSLNTHSYAKR